MNTPAQTPMLYSLQLAQESSYEYSRRNTLSFFDGFDITIILIYIEEIFMKKQLRWQTMSIVF